MNTNLERRRFYLSKESLQYLDELAFKNGTSPSVLLDEILKRLLEKQNKQSS